MEHDLKDRDWTINGQSPEGFARGMAYRTRWHKEKNRKARLEIIEFLGGKCVRCGFDDWRALQVDHINGDGCRDRNRARANTQTLLRNLKLCKAVGYQLLCSNCNWIKRYENDEVRSGPVKWTADGSEPPLKSGRPRYKDCIHGHPLEGDNLYVTPKGVRRCITCRTEEKRRTRERAKGGGDHQSPTDDEAREGI